MIWTLFNREKVERYSSLFPYHDKEEHGSKGRMENEYSLYWGGLRADKNG